MCLKMYAGIISKKIKTALEIGGVSTEESLWSKKGDKYYHLILEKRKKLLYEVIPKKASVHNILITTYGLTHNEYYGDFVRVATLDDLYL